MVWKWLAVTVFHDGCQRELVSRALNTHHARQFHRQAHLLNTCLLFQKKKKILLIILFTVGFMMNCLSEDWIKFTHLQHSETFFLHDLNHINSSRQWKWSVMVTVLALESYFMNLCGNGASISYELWDRLCAQTNILNIAQNRIFTTSDFEKKAKNQSLQLGIPSWKGRNMSCMMYWHGCSWFLDEFAFDESKYIHCNHGITNS